MIKACIFDCDGTLLDTLISISHSANLALEEYGFEAIPAVEYKKMVGDGAKELIRRCLRRRGDTECKNFEPVYERYLEYFKEGCMYQVKPYDGIETLLAELKKRGIQTAVLSNKPHPQTLDVIHDCFPEETFDVIQGWKEEIARKPASDGAVCIQKQLGISPEECFYVGDTDTDMMTGNSAGMHTVGVLWGFRERQELEENHGEFIVETPMEIMKLIDFYNQKENQAK